MPSILDYSILSTDVYDRGYNAGLTELNANSVDTIDGATLLYDSSNMDSALSLGSGYSEDNSFYAAAYSIDGQVVIAYRGTDNPLGDADADISQITGGASEQARLAVLFYNYVRSQVGSGTTITVTGHSLGGALAGDVASLYGLGGQVFDNLPFDGTVSEIRSLISDPNSSSLAQSWYDAVNGGGATVESGYGALFGTSLDGEIAGLTRVFDSLYDSPLDLGNDNVSGPADKHSVSLLVIREFADTASPSDLSWQDAGKYVFPALFSADAATAIGLSQVNGNPANGVMRDEIAYTAGSGSGQPYGNEAAQMFYNGADALGTAIDAGAGIGNTLGQALGETIVEYAGLSAASGGEDGIAAGFLTYDASPQTLTADFSSATWANASTSAVGFAENTILTALLGDVGAELPDGYLDSYVLPDLDKITFATGTSGFSGTVPASDPSDPSGTRLSLFVGTSGSDTIQGADGNNAIFGGNSPSGAGDTITGGSGWNLIVGSNADDTIEGGFNEGGWGDVFGGAGNDTISNASNAYGGAGDDTISDSGFASGGDGNNILTDNSIASGGADNDTFTDDGVVWGGAGTNTIDYTTVWNGSNISVDLLNDPEVTDASLQNFNSSGYPDIILNPGDSDVLQLDGVTLTSAALVPLFSHVGDINPYVYKSSNGYSYSFSSIDENDPVQSLRISGGGSSITLYGFQDGEFGITLTGSLPTGIGAFGAVDPSYYTDTTPAFSVAANQNPTATLGHS